MALASSRSFALSLDAKLKTYRLSGSYFESYAIFIFTLDYA